ncbi:MAG: hypothetical protein U0325_24885 [Polyangiales bacterium]
MRPLLLAVALLGCAHNDLLRGNTSPTPLPADGASAHLHGEHGARAHAHPDRVMTAPLEAPSLHLRVSHVVAATPRLSLDPAIDKRVMRRLRERGDAPLHLPVSLTDLSLDDVTGR